MEAAQTVDTIGPAAAARPPWLASHAAPEIELDDGFPGEIRALLRAGGTEADDCEKLLVWASRARGAIDLAIGEGLDALRQGERLPSLGYHLDDYAREVLDLGKRTAETLAHLARELRTRPLLREALRSGRVRLRAAETVLPVACGEAEARWVEKAARLTVRQLDQEVRAAGADAREEDEPWFRLRTFLSPEEHAIVDVGFDIARALMPGVSRVEALEAMSQEFLAVCPTDPDDDERVLGGAVHPIGPGPERRKARLEEETEAWAALPETGLCRMPDVEFGPDAPAEEIDARLRGLAALRARWDNLVGSLANAIRRSGIHVLLGFASFRHYVEERLQLSPRTVEQRAALEVRIGASPALKEARRQRLPFEKLRLLTKLPEREIAGWVPRAHALTCIALRREIEGERQRQMRAERRVTCSLPLRVALLLAGAFEAVRKRAGALLPCGRCLAAIAWHFIETWLPLVERRKSTVSRKVRDRDGEHCQAPGCSHRADHSHHVEFRSHGGSDDVENQVSVCAFHHWCIHAGWLRVFGRAPDGLRWFLRGSPWTGHAPPRAAPDHLDPTIGTAAAYA